MARTTVVRPTRNEALNDPHIHAHSATTQGYYTLHGHAHCCCLVTRPASSLWRGTCRSFMAGPLCQATLMSVTVENLCFPWMTGGLYFFNFQMTFIKAISSFETFCFPLRLKTFCFPLRLNGRYFKTFLNWSVFPKILQLYSIIKPYRLQQMYVALSQKNR